MSNEALELEGNQGKGHAGEKGFPYIRDAGCIQQRITKRTIPAVLPCLGLCSESVKRAPRSNAVRKGKPIFRYQLAVEKRKSQPYTPQPSQKVLTGND